MVWLHDFNYCGGYCVEFFRWMKRFRSLIGFLCFFSVWIVGLKPSVVSLLGWQWKRQTLVIYPSLRQFRRLGWTAPLCEWHFSELLTEDKSVLDWISWTRGWGRVVVLNWLLSLRRSVEFFLPCVDCALVLLWSSQCSRAIRVDFSFLTSSKGLFNSHYLVDSRSDYSVMICT